MARVVVVCRGVDPRRRWQCNDVRSNSAVGSVVRERQKEHYGANGTNGEGRGMLILRDMKMMRYKKCMLLPLAEVPHVASRGVRGAKKCRR